MTRSLTSDARRCRHSHSPLPGCSALAVAIDAAAPSAKLDFKLPKSTTLGEPAIMTARLYNTTGYRIMADFGVNDQTEFVFLQARPDGSKVRVTPVAHAGVTPADIAV